MKLLLIFKALLLLNFQSAFACHLTFHFNQYPPQAYTDHNGQWQGLDVEMLKLLTAKADCSYNIVTMPWARALTLLSQGKIDGMSSVSQTQERRKTTFFVGPQRHEEIILVSTRKEKITMEHLSNFDTYDKPIAIQRGAYYGERFKKLYESCPNAPASFLEIPDNQTKLWLLYKNRVSGFIEDKFHVNYQLKQNAKFNQLDVYYETLHYTPVYFAFSRVSLSTQQQLRLKKAFIAIQQDNSMHQLKEKYRIE